MSQQKPKWPTCDYPEHVAFVRARVPGSSFTCPKCLRTPEWIDCRDSDDPATTIASLRAENERLTTLLAAAQAECERVRREFGEYRLSRLTSITMKSERSRRAAVDTKGLSDPDALEGIR
jgi:hypothetical protein